jgi:hypothetical protein
VPYRSWWRYDVGQVAQSARDRLARTRGHRDLFDVGHNGGVGQGASRFLGRLSQYLPDWKRVHVKLHFL